MSDATPTFATLIEAAAMQPAAQALPQDKAIEEMKKLIDSGVGINTLDQYGGTALIDACDRGLEEIALFLINANIDVMHKESTFNRTALHFAAEHAMLKTVEKLLEKGVPADDKGSKGFTPLYTCCANAHNERLKNVKVTDADGNEVNDGRKEAAADHYDNFAKVAELLIKNGADASYALPEMQQSALFPTAHFGDEALVKLLLENGAKADATDKFGMIPLHYAARSGSKETLQLLLDAGSDVNAQEDYGYTPLMEAILHNHAELVTMLLDAGADRMLALKKDYQTHKAGNNAIDIAIANGNDEVLKLVSTDK